MEDLNHYEISRILGSKVKAIGGSRFGGFGLIRTTAEALKAKEHSQQARTDHKDITLEDERLIVQAFEEIRDGAAPDRILWNKDLALKFEQRCRELGMRFSPTLLKKRLLNIRKNSPRYAERGIVISPTTKREPQKSVVWRYAHAIEFALVRLRYRYGASIDDILLDDELGDKFEEQALAMAPSLSSSELRLGALFIRKTRRFKPEDRAVFEALNPGELAGDWSQPMYLSSVSDIALPSTPGLIEVDEDDRCLYISRSENVAPAISEFRSGAPFRAMTGPFWSPDRDHISVRYIPGEKIHGTAAQKWALRLIASNKPVFNWPIKLAA